MIQKCPKEGCTESVTITGIEGRSNFTMPVGTGTVPTVRVQHGTDVFDIDPYAASERGGEWRTDLERKLLRLHGG